MDHLKKVSLLEWILQFYYNYISEYDKCKILKIPLEDIRKTMYHFLNVANLNYINWNL